MNNVEFVKEIAYQERMHRSLHGERAAKQYTDALRKAASLVHVDGVFKDVTFNKYGLPVGGPFGE